MPTPFLNQRDPREELAQLLAQAQPQSQPPATPTIDQAAQSAQQFPGLDEEIASRGLGGAPVAAAGMTPAEDYLGTPAQLEVIERLKRANALRHPPNPGVGTPSMDIPTFGGIR